jgi:oligopeptide transport system permease protein
MASATATPATMPVPKRRSSGSLWSDAFYRLIRNRAAVMGGTIIIVLILLAIFAPVIYPRGYDVQRLALNHAIPQWLTYVFPMMKPGKIAVTTESGLVKAEPIPGVTDGYVTLANQFPIGADTHGRDLLTRIIYGAQVSLAVAFVGPLISLIVGTAYGTISGYIGGRTDNMMMRVVDVLYAFPSLLFIILLMAFFRNPPENPQTTWENIRFTLSQVDRRFGGLFFIFVGIGLTAWETMARLARGQILSVKEKEFIEAAKTIGAKPGRIMSRHILPNIVGPLIVAETLAIPSYISTEAFLSFIGLGVNRPTPSWGSMIADGAQAIRSYPHEAIFPALALAITMFAFNFLGDGLRDALDPRLRGTQ